MSYSGLLTNDLSITLHRLIDRLTKITNWHPVSSLPAQASFVITSAHAAADWLSRVIYYHLGKKEKTSLSKKIKLYSLVRYFVCLFPARLQLSIAIIIPQNFYSFTFVVSVLLRLLTESQFSFCIFLLCHIKSNHLNQIQSESSLQFAYVRWTNLLANKTRWQEPNYRTDFLRK